MSPQSPSPTSCPSMRVSSHRRVPESHQEQKCACGSFTGLVKYTQVGVVGNRNSAYCWVPCILAVVIKMENIHEAAGRLACFLLNNLAFDSPKTFSVLESIKYHRLGAQH